MLKGIREAGLFTGGGPPPVTQRDRSRFLHALDALVRKALREEVEGSPPP